MSNEAAGLLKHFLEQRLVAGQTHVVLKPGMLSRLKLRGQPAKKQLPEARRMTETPAAVEQPAATKPVTRFERAVPQPAAAFVAPALIEVAGSTKAEKLAALAAKAQASPEIRTLGTLRETLVFGVGSPDAEILFIGETPGFEEEEQQQPFVGPAGLKLNGIITAMGLKREAIYISNVCLFRPAIQGEQGSTNRAATEAEVATCMPYVLTQISIIRPKVIVALGVTASKAFGIGDALSRLRGKFYEVSGIPTMVSYHPSYIIREEKLGGGGMQAKREVWEDMLKVMEKVGIPINEKQRSYFRK